MVRSLILTMFSAMMVTTLAVEVAGAGSPPVIGSVNIPTTKFDAKNYPEPNAPPVLNSREVQAWLKEIDLSKVPKLALSASQDCTKVPPKNVCRWTCDGCINRKDFGELDACPTPKTWGLTFDDGPTQFSPRLYDFLKKNNIKASLFVIGSNIVQFPETLKRAYSEGHHIALHSWSHPALTTLSNEKIVAEMKWNQKVVKDIIGVSPIYMRPPFGDIDNRVRGVLKAMGMISVIWTKFNNVDFDTNDWQLDPTHVLITPQKILNNFDIWIQTVPKMKSGIVSLEHELYKQTVDVALQLIPRGMKASWNIQSVASCNNIQFPYVEQTNFIAQVPQNGSPLPSGVSAAAQPSGQSASTSAVANNNGVSSNNANAAAAFDPNFSLSTGVNATNGYAGSNSSSLPATQLNSSATTLSDSLLILMVVWSLVPFLSSK